MKFLSWLFGVSRRHHAGIRRYEKGGAGVRIFTAVLSLLLAAAVLGLEYWLLSSLADENSLGGGLTKLVALIFIGILFVAIFFGSLEFFAIYCVTAFRMAICGAALSSAKRKQTADQPIENAEAEPSATPFEQGKYKAADVVVGILQILLIAGVIVGVIVIATRLL